MKHCKDNALILIGWNGHKFVLSNIKTTLETFARFNDQTSQAKSAVFSHYLLTSLRGPNTKILQSDWFKRWVQSNPRWTRWLMQRLACNGLQQTIKSETTTRWWWCHVLGWDNWQWACWPFQSSRWRKDELTNVQYGNFLQDNLFLGTAANAQHSGRR